MCGSGGGGGGAYECHVRLQYPGPAAFCARFWPFGIATPRITACFCFGVAVFASPPPSSPNTIRLPTTAPQPPVPQRDPNAPITIYHIGDPAGPAAAAAAAPAAEAEAGAAGAPKPAGPKPVAPWWDLCAGPHVERTGDINPDAVELENVTGAPACVCVCVCVCVC